MKNVFYFYHLNELGGVETFFWHIARKYEDWDITIFYDSGDPKQLARLRKYVDVRRHYKGQLIECEKFFTNYNVQILDDVRAKEIIQIIHADYKAQGLEPNTHPRITRYIAVSEQAKKSFEELTGLNVGLAYNPYKKEPTHRVLRLISATRLTPEKGRERIEKLAKILDDNGVLYSWEIYSNTKAFANPNVIVRKPRLDVTDFMATADFLVQLSDSEAYCYTVVEALSVGTPVIVTDLPVYDELGLDETNSIRLDLDLKDVPIGTMKKWKKRVVKYKPPEDRWGDLLADGKSKYYEKTKVRAVKPFMDLEAKAERQVGDSWTVSKARASYLEELQLVRRETI